MVAETSWATGLEDSDGHANTVREGNNDAGMDYDFSIYGQAKELREVINAVAEMDKGIGVFYWEPAWIPVKVYDENAENAANVLTENKAAWENMVPAGQLPMRKNMMPRMPENGTADPQ